MAARWSDDELETLRINYAEWPTYLIAHVLRRPLSAVLAMAHKQGLKKSADYNKGPHAKVFQRGHRTGTRFKKGHVPANKGIKHPPGWAPGRTAETRFKKGGQPFQTHPVGTELVDGEGYLARKVRDDAPLGQARRNWERVHVRLWITHRGPIPPSHCVCFINSDKTDIRIENLELITRAERMRRNSYHTRYPELASVIQLRGVLTRLINRRSP